MNIKKNTERIELVTLSEIGQVMNIYKAAIKKMEEMHIFQWDNKYPDISTAENDIRNNTLYGFFINNHLCATQTIDNLPPEEYKEIHWHYPDDNALVLHRLCVDPNYQNKGIAKKLLSFTEAFAKKHLFQTIRLDTFTKNPLSNRIYKDLGYIERGTIQFRMGDFFCYEKVIINS